MKQGRTLLELGKELERQRLVRKDYIADTRNLEVTTRNDIIKIALMLNDEISESFILNDLAHQQIASRLQIPFKYYQKMKNEYPSLLDKNINCWFNKNGERRMSSSYRLLYCGG